jgi:predicted HicB family RNase H-like nuclease
MQQTKGKKIHITLPEEVHRRLRVKCALEDITIQEYVSELISNDVTNIDLLVKNANPHRSKKSA